MSREGVTCGAKGNAYLALVGETQGQRTFRRCRRIVL